MFTKRACIAGIGAIMFGALFAGCETTHTTVVDARSGRPLGGARIAQSDGTVVYTNDHGTVERTVGTTAQVSRPGYRSVKTYR